jgi:hypothetical protein
MNSIPPPETMYVLKPEQFEHRLEDHLGEGAAGFRMFRGGDPVGDRFAEFLDRHPGMCGGHQLKNRFLAAGERVLGVALEHGGERLGCFPLGMFRGHRFDPVEREEELEVHRLFGPERAVVVEDGDAFRDRHKIGRAFRRDARHERADRVL